MFFQETQLKVHKFESCKFKLGFVNCLVVDSDRRSREIAMLWGKDINLSILSYSKFHINACIKEDESRRMQHFITNIYRHPEPSLRQKTWDLIQSLCRNEDGVLWLVFGDFNEILYQQEK